MSRMRPGETNLVLRVPQGVKQRIEADMQGRGETLNKWLLGAIADRLTDTLNGGHPAGKDESRYAGNRPVAPFMPPIGQDAAVSTPRHKPLTRKQIRQDRAGRCFDCGCAGGMVDPKSCRLFTCACHAE